MPSIMPIAGAAPVPALNEIVPVVTWPSTEESTRQTSVYVPGAAAGESRTGIERVRLPVDIVSGPMGIVSPDAARSVAALKPGSMSSLKLSVICEGIAGSAAPDRGFEITRRACAETDCVAPKAAANAIKSAGRNRPAVIEATRGRRRMILLIEIRAFAMTPGVAAMWLLGRLYGRHTGRGAVRRD